MNLKEYQKIAFSTAAYPNTLSNLLYPTLGLIGESGELAEKIKKSIRDDNNTITGQKKNNILLELSDILWYTSALCSEIGTDISILWDMRDCRIYHCLDGYDLNRLILKLNLCVAEITKLIEGQCYNNRPINKFQHIHSPLLSILNIINVIANKFGTDIFTIADININKLQDRLNRNVISGSGDNR